MKKHRHEAYDGNHNEHGDVDDVQGKYGHGDDGHGDHNEHGDDDSNNDDDAHGELMGKSRNMHKMGNRHHNYSDVIAMTL